MKTSIKTFIAAALTAVVLSTSAFAADKTAEQNVTVLSNIKTFNKIKVSGNVELILVQGPTQSVKVYDNYYAKNALVQEQNGELFISSFTAEKLTVVAYVKDLASLTATDNATVSSFGKLSLLSLDVKLVNNATADLNINALSLRSNVGDSSNLILAGTAEEHTAKIESIAKVNMDKFKAATTTIAAKNVVAKVTPAVADDVDAERLGK